jgi:hypothetical protein
MKKVFTHENRMIVFNMKNLLQSEGIETVVVNEFAGGGVGDLSAFDTWPELWLEDESRLSQAQAIVQEIQHKSAGDNWFCRGCQEPNDASFEICWKCGRSCE